MGNIPPPLLIFPRFGPPVPTRRIRLRRGTITPRRPADLRTPSLGLVHLPFAPMFQDLVQEGTDGGGEGPLHLDGNGATGTEGLSREPERSRHQVSTPVDLQLPLSFEGIGELVVTPGKGTRRRGRTARKPAGHSGQGSEHPPHRPTGVGVGGHVDGGEEGVPEAEGKRPGGPAPEGLLRGWVLDDALGLEEVLETAVHGVLGVVEETHGKSRMGATEEGAGPLPIDLDQASVGVVEDRDHDHAHGALGPSPCGWWRFLQLPEGTLDGPADLLPRRPPLLRVRERHGLDVDEPPGRPSGHRYRVHLLGVIAHVGLGVHLDVQTAGHGHRRHLVPEDEVQLGREQVHRLGSLRGSGQVPWYVGQADEELRPPGRNHGPIGIPGSVGVKPGLGVGPVHPDRVHHQVEVGVCLGRRDPNDEAPHLPLRNVHGHPEGAGGHHSSGQFHPDAVPSLQGLEG